MDSSPAIKGVQAISSGTALPLVIAVTGHRDLVETELEGIRTRVRTFFNDMQSRYPDCRLTVMSPLAEGADTLVAEIACEMSLDLVVPLPKAKDHYLEDFRNDEAKEKFLSLCDHAVDLYELPETIPPPPPDIDRGKWQSDYPYAQLGIYLSAHCHILLALWDGNSSTHLGGTAQVVKFHHDDVMPGITTRTTSSQQSLVDDESDLVFHIVCSRQRNGNNPSAEFPPLESYWYTKDSISPRSRTLPEQHELIFRRISEFYADVRRFEDRIDKEGDTLLGKEETNGLPVGIETINRFFARADWLAIHYQRLTLTSLAVIHVMALLMGMMFILYSDFESLRYFLFAFVIAFGVGWAAQYFARRGAWHRKYLDYRTLAEGLRIQLYWAAAGVASERKWRFTHDSYLQSQNPEFGWIRNIMRVAGARCDAALYEHPRGLEFSLREWIGNSDSGQLGYFIRKSGERGHRHKVTSALGLASLVTSVIIVFVFLFLGDSLTDSTATFLRVVMGAMLLLFAVREGYAYSTAEKELLKQYEYMQGIYGNAERRLENAPGTEEKRQILRALGQSALNEHSSWILMHRERSPEKEDIWRMGG